MEKVHTYAGPASGKGYRDPRLAADPTKLTFSDDLGSYSPGPNSPNPGYGAVNPNVGYSNSHAVYVSDPPVVLERYCLCAPKTDGERRLLVAVIVLAVICVGMLTAMLLLLTGGEEECKEGNGNCGGLVDLLPFMTSRLQAMV